MNRYLIAESFSRLSQSMHALRSELPEENSPAFDLALSAIQIARTVSLMASCGFHPTATETTVEQLRAKTPACVREAFRSRVSRALEIYSPAQIAPDAGADAIVSIIELIPTALSPQVVSEICSTEYCKAIGVDTCTDQCFYIETIVREAFGLPGDVPISATSYHLANSAAVEIHGKIFRSRNTQEKRHPEADSANRLAAA